MTTKSNIVTVLRLLRFIGSVAMFACVVAGAFGYGDHVKLAAAAGGGIAGVFLKGSSYFIA